MLNGDITKYRDSNLHLKLLEINDFYTNENISNYLIKWYKEDDFKYDWRKNVSYYQNYVSPIVNGLTNMIFNKAHIIEVDENYEKNIDLLDTPLLKFMQQVTKNAIRDGLTFLIADTNKNDNSPISKLDEVDLGFRAYLKNFEYKQLVSWKYDKNILTQIVFKDSIDIDIDDFSIKTIDCYIVFKIGGGEVYYNETGTPELKYAWENDLNYIPISIIYGSLDSKGVIANSIVWDIVKLNKSHLNLKSGLMNICHIASNPIPTIWGLPDNANTLSLGVNTPLVFPTKQGNAYDFEWKEITGSSVNIAIKEIEALEDYIISSSFNILKIETFKTATEARINYGRNKTILNAIADSLESGINQALKICEDLTNSKIGEIKLNKDFSDILMTAENIKALLELRKNGDISLETLWDSLIKGEVIEIEDYEKEKEELTKELNLGIS